MLPRFRCASRLLRGAPARQQQRMRRSSVRQQRRLSRRGGMFLLRQNDSGATSPFAGAPCAVNRDQPPHSAWREGRRYGVDRSERYARGARRRAFARRCAPFRYALYTAHAAAGERAVQLRQASVACRRQRRLLPRSTHIRHRRCRQRRQPCHTNTHNTHTTENENCMQTQRENERAN